MSAPLRLNAQQLRRLARALDVMSKSRCETGVSLTPLSPAQVSVDGSTALDVTWNDDALEYEIDDRVGS